MDLTISSLLCFIRIFIIISMVDLSHVSFISSPILHPSLSHLLLRWWSPNRGQQIIGTPASMLSKIEFQPLWVKNPPTAGWTRTSSCEAQSTTNSLFFCGLLNLHWDHFIHFHTFNHITLYYHKNNAPLLTKPYQNSNN